MNATQFEVKRQAMPVLAVDGRTAAVLLAVSEKTIYRLRKSGKLRASLLEGAVRYRITDLEEYLEQAREH